MQTQECLQLHFDVRSGRALLTYGNREYLLPEVYSTKEKAQTAAQHFAWEELGWKHRAPDIRGASDVPVWLR
ncbi:hypothetical protein SJ05684_b45650 (plasmid) [Sinorhizobium sojae CCBAU 05684]|uniref:Uncharacterized protein n=1 Tax=Sinorhizobium sojae CCBAU 05684 TaxID=716928 RepID=A0A249PIH9_9HYPH|nr:hypothetical protein [Sinorhizobium sojae]ASY65547.1 hypothetical protein SJ05684_b45650 [Sinorhizobium sojae CCBAU 05684]